MGVCCSEPEIDLNGQGALRGKFSLSFDSFRQFKYERKVSDYYKIGDSLASGAFGTVFAATRIKTGQKCAIKIMQKPKKDKIQNIELFKQELTTL